MTATDCPFPARCPVPRPTDVALPFRTVVLDQGQPWFTVYESEFASKLFNDSGNGNARFSPLFDREGPVGSVYLARQPIGALLETAFHEMRPGSENRIALADLRGRGMRQVMIPEQVLLADVRDPELSRHGIDRSSLVSSSAAHYRCTREWATKVRSEKRQGRGLAGIIWHSRVGEIAAERATPTIASLLAHQPLEVCVMFADRLSGNDLRQFQAVETFADLSTGIGLALATDLAVQLGGYVDP